MVEKKTKLRTITAVLVLATVQAAAADPCAPILKNGFHNESNQSRRVTSENTSERYICSHKGDSLSDKKALELGFMIRFLGRGGESRIGLDKDVVKSWIDRKCSNDVTTGRNTTEETSYSRSADKAIAEVWLRCMTLQFGKGNIAVSEEVGAQDQSGRPFRFRIAVVGIPYYWDKASTGTVMLNGSAVDIRGQFRSPDWGDVVNGAKDVFAVGTASCGGAKTKEIDRSLARAHQLRDWIDAAHGQPFVRGTINLGKYQDEYCAEGSRISDMQRPVMVLLVTERPIHSLRAIDYQSALMDAATSHPSFQFDRYSNFDIALR
jgi:hypothetical protein